MTFPISRVDHRTWDADWSGDVVVCDIDRTYLQTRFSSLKGMARIPTEFAVDKLAIAGMVSLLKELRRGPGEHSRHTPLYFISASPRQMRPVIERKMLMDGIEQDGTTFKDWIGVLKRLKTARFKEQIGFKLTGLMMGRLALPAGAREILIGDDLELDALAYSLYADILAGRIDHERILPLLTHLGVDRDDAFAIADLKRMVADRDGVRRAYIRLERTDDPAVFLEFFPHLVPCRGAFQMSVSLWSEGCISLRGVVRVAEELTRRGYGAPDFIESLEDVGRRALVPEAHLSEVCGELVGLGVLESPITARPDRAWVDALAGPGEMRTPGRFLDQ